MRRHHPKIIAEIGFNHAGDIELAKRMITAAAVAGADIVKFQTFLASELVLPKSPHYNLIKQGEMSLEQHQSLAEFAREKNIDFMSTPFSRRGVDMLEKVGVNSYKVASMDLTNLYLLEYIAQTGKAIYLSTGMATLSEISYTMEFLNSYKNMNVSLLHCISNYPTKAKDLNLRTIPLLKSIFTVPVGYSDHYPGVKACLNAAILGADILETHFTLDTSMSGPDHAHSVTKEMLRQLIEDIKSYNEMAGNESFFILRKDRSNASSFRRGIYAARSMVEGDIIKSDDLILCRPESEFSTHDFGWLLGQSVKKPIKKYESLSRDHI